MTTTIELNAWSIIREYAKRATVGINKWLEILLKELEKLTPEDTGDMLSSYVVERARDTWSSIIWSVSNSAWHAIYVERGQSGKAFTYHKPKWNPFYQWVGNRTFARAVDNTRDKIIQIIYQEINR